MKVGLQPDTSELKVVFVVGWLHKLWDYDETSLLSEELGILLPIQLDFVTPTGVDIWNLLRAKPEVVRARISPIEKLFEVSICHLEDNEFESEALISTPSVFPFSSVRRVLNIVENFDYHHRRARPTKKHRSARESALLKLNQ